MSVISPARPEEKPEQCECLNWCRDLTGFLWSHHPNCRKHRPDVEARGYVQALVDGIEQWGAEEDGIPDFLWDAYCRAVYALGRPLPIRREDDASK